MTAADGAEKWSGGKLGNWPADLASALSARGHGVLTTPQGMTVTPGR